MKGIQSFLLEAALYHCSGCYFCLLGTSLFFPLGADPTSITTVVRSVTSMLLNSGQSKSFLRTFSQQNLVRKVPFSFLDIKCVPGQSDIMPLPSMQKSWSPSLKLTWEKEAKWETAKNNGWFWVHGPSCLQTRSTLTPFVDLFTWINKYLPPLYLKNKTSF